MEANVRTSDQTRRTRRPDGTLGPPLKRPWAQWDVLARGDIVASVLGAVATLLTAGSLFWGPPASRLANPAGFVWTAPLVAVLFFIAMVAMFVERERHGIARALFGGGALILAIAAIVFMGEAPPGRLVAFYWLPAILAVGSGLALTRSKREVDHVETKVPRRPTDRRPPSPR
jgi:hypothetical protein